MCVSLRLFKSCLGICRLYVSGCLKCFVVFEVFLGVCLFKTQSCLGIWRRTASLQLLVSQIRSGLMVFK